MSDHDLDPFEAVRRAGEKPYAERISLERNARGELAGVVDAEPADDGGPADVPAEEWAPGWEPEPVPMPSLEERLGVVEQCLGPRAVEAERERQLTQHEQLVAQAHDLDPRQLAALVDQATRQAVAERLGVVEQPAASMEAVIAAADGIAGHHLDNWDELRPAVIAEMTRDPSWLHAVNGSPDAATLASTYVTVASTLRAAESARSQASENKRQAATMTGAGVRQAGQSDDQAYWERVRAAGRGGYGS